METLECIKTRRSVRKFKTDSVSKETIEKLVLAASYAPSWKNTQTTRYIAITNEEVKARLATECCAEHNAQEKVGILQTVRLKKLLGINQTSLEELHI